MTWMQTPWSAIWARYWSANVTAPASILVLLPGMAPPLVRPSRTGRPRLRRCWLLAATSARLRIRDGHTPNGPRVQATAGPSWPSRWRFSRSASGSPRGRRESRPLVPVGNVLHSDAMVGDAHLAFRVASIHPIRPPAAEGTGMPVRIGQVGTKHGHARGKWQALRANADVEAVGIWEPDPVARATGQRDPA